MKESIVISVGGSLIVPNGGLDTDFLTKLNTFIRRNISKNRRFFLIAGGGATARHYIKAGREVIKRITNEDLDWLGIHSTHLNAHLLRTIFRDIAHPRILINYDRKIANLKEPVVIGGGWKPGWSTDYDAVRTAQDYNANLIINLSNIYWVYDKDPKKYKSAKKIEKTTWDYYETLIGNKWTPGLSTPFDPVAVQLAKQLGLTVIVTKGDDFRNLQRILDGQSFRGTVIKPYNISSAYYDRQYYFGEKGEYRYSGGINYWRDFAKKLITWYRALYLKLLLNPKSVLDVGCGTGDLVKTLRKLGIDAKGLDISLDAIGLADKEVQPFLTSGDIIKIPHASNTFELVVTFDVLEHIDREKLKKAISETVRVAKKYILHKIYTQENTFINVFHGDDPSHASLHSQGFWSRLFTQVKNITVARKFFRLPTFLETVYLLKKN